MAEQDSQNQQNKMAGFLSSISTRLRDLEERNKMLRERVLLLGKNLISIKESIEEDNDEIKIQLREMKKEFDKVISTNKSMSSEASKFVKRDEIRLIERMLKDFQPLEFARAKDLEELENRIIGAEKSKQNLNKKEKTKKTKTQGEI